MTLTILVDPLTSYAHIPFTCTPHLTLALRRKLCGHSYSAASIREYLNVRGGRKECPAAGCHKMISMSDLVQDKELAKKAKDAARRERMREEDSDEDEGDVIE